MKWFTTPRRNASSVSDPEPLLIKIGPLTNQSDKKQHDDKQDDVEKVTSADPDENQGMKLLFRNFVKMTCTLSEKPNLDQKKYLR